MTGVVKMDANNEFGRSAPSAAVRRIVAGALVMLAAGIVGTAPASGQTKDYAEVSWQGKPVDTCLYPGSQCGKPAADKFCKLMGHAEAVSWSIIEGIGEKFPTITLGDMKTCSGPDCDAFLTMTCKLQPTISAKDQPTPTARARGVPPPPTRGERVKAQPQPERVQEIPGGPPPIAEAKLVTTSASVQPASPTAGQQIMVAATVQNQGGMPSQYGLGLFLFCTQITGQPACPDSKFSVLLPSLAAGQVHSTIVPTGVSWSAGKYRLVIGTDLIFGHDMVELELVVAPVRR